MQNLWHVLFLLKRPMQKKWPFICKKQRDMGLCILPPDINQLTDSILLWLMAALLFGLQGIKNVGLAALENIIQERSKKGPFKDLFDFCKRVDLRTVNKRVIENLICAGAFDALPGNRAQQFEEAQQIMDKAAAHKKDTATGQMGLFGGMQTDMALDDQGYVFAPRKEWSDKEKLEKEQAVIGFYLSSHPLDIYRQQLGWFNVATFDKVLEQLKASNGQESMVVVCGMLQARKDIVTKKGDRMSFVQLEDSVSTAELVIFPKAFTKVEQWLDTYNVFVVKGFIDAESKNKCKIKVQDMTPIELVLQEWPQVGSILFTLPQVIVEEQVEKLKASLVAGSIPLELIFHENGKKLHVSTKMKIGLDQQMLCALEKEYQITAQCEL